MTNILYFAYGSNMLTQRLTARCLSAQPVGVAYAPDHGLEFWKRGKDGSGKATLVPRPDTRQFGVLFQINTAELSILDAIEGVGFGYDRNEDFPVICASSGTKKMANTYLATQPDNGLKPFDWYLALVIAGAKQHNLPIEQILAFHQTPYLIDTQSNRQGRLDALVALGNNGIISNLRV